MNEQSNKKACVYFHQGWTDIVMCLPLIDYYSNIYNEIFVIIRSDAKDLVDFYVKNKKGVNIVYINTDNGRYYGNINTECNIDNVEYINNSLNISKDIDTMFHAEHDIHRKDVYKGYWNLPDFMKKNTRHFSEMFYVFYGIDFNVRITEFNVERDQTLESNIYEEFIKKYGENYIIYHDDESNHQNGIHHVSTKIDFDVIEQSYTYVNINKQSKIFFDYIKVLQNAKEIHLVDSVWACLLYQMDSKYGVFGDKIINVYCKRGHQNLLQCPKKLENWILK